MKAGALDFIEKPFDKTDILPALEAAAQLMDPARPATCGSARAVLSAVAKLMPREREVMDLIVSGHANKVIAHRLEDLRCARSRSIAPG